MTGDQKQAKDEGRKAGRARSLAKFTLSEGSEILRFAQNDSEGFRMTAEGQGGAREFSMTR
jgi:hypothetical protein